MQSPSPSPAASALPPRMKALLQFSYGEPELLVAGETALPEIGDEGVLVQVVTASLNKGDWHLVTGKPYLIRIAGYGLFKPTRPIPGMAIAGKVAAVGSLVKGLRVGDEVFGEINRGAFAEYVSVTEKELAKMPPGLSFEAAATLPVAATTALQGLRDAAEIQPGQSVLINGAAGGVGTFAVQVAKALGAQVTAVCSTPNVSLVRSLGADHVVDYKQEDFTQKTPRYDVILDLIGNHSLRACRGVLTASGRYISGAGGAEHEWIGPLFKVLGGLLSNFFSKQRFVPLVAKPNPADLLAVAELIQAGKVQPVIRSRLTLQDVPAAIHLQGQGHCVGRQVVVL